MSFRKNASACIYFGLTSTGTGVLDTSGNFSLNRSRDNDTQASCTGNLVNKGNGQFALVTSSDDLNGNSVGFLILGPGVAAFSLTVLTDGMRNDLNGNVLGSVQGNIGGNMAGSAASVTGAVGSVTGAVGSVTGNLGGNVNGNVVGNVNGNVLGSVQGNVGGTVFLLGVGALSEAAVSAAAATKIADAQFDEADGIEVGLTMRQEMRLSAAANAGTTSGMGTTQCFIFPAVAGGGTARIQMNMDSVGNRSGAVYNL